MLLLQALPEDKKPLSAELFWLTFRLHAGLPLSPRDSHAGVDLSAGESDTVRQLFKDDEPQRHGHREMALLVLCSFAEGGFTRAKRKKSRVGRMRVWFVPVVGEMLTVTVYLFSMYTAFQSHALFP